MNKYNVVMEMNDSTVVTEYEPVKRKSDSYQSEQALENEFIRMLTEQGYDYLKIHDSESLIKNLRTQLEIVNDYIKVRVSTEQKILFKDIAKKKKV